MKLLDTNLIIRFLLKDHPIQSHKAKELLENPKENLILTDVTIAEIIWLLTSFYNLSKNQVIEKIYNLISLHSINLNRSRIIRTLYFYSNFNIDYIDAYHAAYFEEEKLEGIYSFDEGLDKIKSVKRLQP